MKATYLRLVCLLFVLTLGLPGGARAQPRLSFLQTLTDGADGVDRLRGALDTAMSSDGRFIYVVAQNDGAVSVFERDRKTGILTFIEALVDGLQGVEGIHGAQGISISPDGLNLYTASLEGGSVAVFRRDPVTGRLTFVEAERETGSTFATQLEKAVVSPDGRHAYATVFQGGILQYRRDLATGALELLRRFDGSLVGADEAKLSPDGAFLYVAASVDDSVLVLARDVDSGELTLVATYTNGSGGLDSLDGATGITFGPAGRTVYVLSSNNDEGTITIFDRDHVTGLLTLRSAIRGEAGGALGLWGANRMAIDASGRWAYVVSQFDAHVSAFQRDTATGDLTFFDTRPAGNRGITVSPDERHLYVTTFTALLAYAIGAPEDGCSPRQDLLCLRDRFEATISWNDGRGHAGVGKAVPGSNDTTGLFWFFKPENWELQVKVLDGCANNGRFWVFASASTNVEYTLRVRDTESGAIQDYFHPFGSPAPAITDTQAFATCP